MTNLSKTTRELGSDGENVAERYLKKSGFNILDRNFRCRGGEVDIICNKENTIHFVEVKTRRSQKFGDAVEAVNSTKQRRISLAAQVYLMTHAKYSRQGKSFSVLAIDHSQGKPAIEFIQNAFESKVGYY